MVTEAHHETFFQRFDTAMESCWMLVPSGFFVPVLDKLSLDDSHWMNAEDADQLTDADSIRYFRERLELSLDKRGVAYACAWLNNIRSTKVQSRYTSDFYSAEVSRWSGQPVSGGAFLLAALILGFSIERVGRGDRRGTVNVNKQDVSRLRGKFNRHACVVLPH